GGRRFHSRRPHRLRTRSTGNGWRRRDCQAREIPMEDLLAGLPGGREPGRADDAHADAVSGAVSRKAIRVAIAFELERGALDELPAQCSSDHDAQILPGDGFRIQSVEPETADAPRPVA